MRLYHQSLESKVERPLADLTYIVLASCHMTRIHKERKFREAVAKLNGHLPLRIVAILDLVECRESSVDDAEFLYAGAVQTLERSDPQVKVRICRILDQYGNISIFESICNLLHEERIGCGSGSDPHKVHSELQAFEHMLLARNFSRDLQSILFLCLLHPAETLGTGSLKASRMSPRLPYACSVNIDSHISETLCGLHHLLL